MGRRDRWRVNVNILFFNVDSPSGQPITIQITDGGQIVSAGVQHMGFSANAIIQITPEEIVIVDPNVSGQIVANVTVPVSATKAPTMLVTFSSDSDGPTPDENACDGTASGACVSWPGEDGLGQQAPFSGGPFLLAGFPTDT